MRRVAAFVALAVFVVPSLALAQTYAADELTLHTVERRAVEAVIWGMPAVNFELLYQAMTENKGAGNQIVYYSHLPDWKNQTLTPNPDTIYFLPFYNTKDVGPIVLEIPPADEGEITGSVDDGWQTAIEDVGPAGVDKGKGGKYLILPPGYTSPIPAGYIAMPSQTYSGFAILRSNIGSGSDADIAKAVTYGKRVKLYPLSQASPPSTTFLDVADRLVRQHHSLRSALLPIARPICATRAMVGTGQGDDRSAHKSIGIEKGKPFNPDPKTQEILNRAASEAHIWLDTHLRSYFFRALFRRQSMGGTGFARGCRRFADEFREPRQLPDRWPRRHVFVRLLQRQASRYRPVLFNDDQRQGRPALRRRSHLSPECSSQCAGQTVLVGNRL